jgi:hypothetical protein
MAGTILLLHSWSKHPNTRFRNHSLDNCRSTRSGKSVTDNPVKQQDKFTEAQEYSISALSAIETVKCSNGQEIEREEYL